MARVLVSNLNNAGRVITDVIHVIEDDMPFGRLEGPPDFNIVEFPGVPASDLWYLTSEYQEDATAKTPPTVRKLRRLSRGIENGDRKILAPCRYQVDPSTKQITDKRA